MAAAWRPTLHVWCADAYRCRAKANGKLANGGHANGHANGVANGIH